jgi:serine/threonine protein kinase
MGAVYRAREIALERPVAIKVLPPEFASNRRAVERFMREARLAANLRHPNIVSIHAVGERQGIHYFTMDLIEGETLQRLIARKARGQGLSQAEARTILLAIAKAVDHAHRRGVVHRDLKPANIMVQSDGRVLVMDFGLARGEESSSLTQPGAVVGTPRYMSPEQAEGKPATARSDIYAVGLIYYLMLTGTDLATGDSVGAIVAQHLSGTLADRVRASTSLLDQDRALILGMIERASSDRISSMEMVIEALRGQIPSGASPGPCDQTAPPPSQPSPLPKPAARPIRKKTRKRLEKLLDELEREQGE